MSEKCIWDQTKVCDCGLSGDGAKNWRSWLGARVMLDGRNEALRKTLVRWKCRQAVDAAGKADRDPRMGVALQG